jgi:putative endonuclease
LNVIARKFILKYIRVISEAIPKELGMIKGGYVYILTNKRISVLHVGVTSALKRRIWEHKNKIEPTSFSARYNCDILLYYNDFHSIEEAISEEKRLKAGSRKQKLDLVFAMNPLWKDLYDFIED